MLFLSQICFSNSPGLSGIVSLSAAPSTVLGAAINHGSGVSFVIYRLPEVLGRLSHNTVENGECQIKQLYPPGALAHPSRTWPQGWRLLPARNIAYQSGSYIMSDERHIRRLKRNTEMSPPTTESVMGRGTKEPPVRIEDNLSSSNSHWVCLPVIRGVNSAIHYWYRDWAITFWDSTHRGAVKPGELNVGA